jgi:hypothetical protein
VVMAFAGQGRHSVPSRKAARLSTANGWVDFMGWDS